MMYPEQNLFAECGTPRIGWTCTAWDIWVSQLSSFASAPGRLIIKSWSRVFECSYSRFIGSSATQKFKNEMKLSANPFSDVSSEKVSQLLHRSPAGASKGRKVTFVATQVLFHDSCHDLMSSRRHNNSPKKGWTRVDRKEMGHKLVPLVNITMIARHTAPGIIYIIYIHISFWWIHAIFSWYIAGILMIDSD